MNRPPERDFTDFVPSVPAFDEAGARLRLWRSIEQEKARRHRRRRSVRGLVALAVLLFVFTSAPPTADTSGRQLLRLAEAVAESGALAPGGPDVWYERSVSVEHVEVPSDWVAPLGVESFQFDVPQVTETWIAADGAVRRRISYGQPRFPIGVDGRVFDLARLGDRYPVGRVVETLGVSEQPSPYDLPWGEGAEAVREVIGRQVLASSDARPASAQVLDIVIRLLQQERAFPARRATLFRILASTPGLQITTTDQGLTVAARYVLGQEAMEKRIVFDRRTGDLVSHVVERLATPTSSSYMVEQQWFVESGNSSQPAGASPGATS